METAASRQRGNAPGPTAAEVARNIKRVRFARNLSQQELSDRMTDIGRPIPVSSIGKIESGLRTVDVDDLVALAVALDVSPLGLLLPRAGRGEDVAEVTGLVKSADLIWTWAAGISSTTDDALEPDLDHYNPNDVTELSMPRWLALSPLITRFGPGQTPEATPRRWPFAPATEARVPRADG